MTIKNIALLSLFFVANSAISTERNKVQQAIKNQRDQLREKNHHITMSSFLKNEFTEKGFDSIEYCFENSNDLSIQSLIDCYNKHMKIASKLQITISNDGPSCFLIKSPISFFNLRFYCITMYGQSPHYSDDELLFIALRSAYISNQLKEEMMKNIMLEVAG